MGSGGQKLDAKAGAGEVVVTPFRCASDVTFLTFRERPPGERARRRDRSEEGRCFCYSFSFLHRFTVTSRRSYVKIQRDLEKIQSWGTRWMRLIEKNWGDERCPVRLETRNWGHETRLRDISNNWRFEKEIEAIKYQACENLRFFKFIFKKILRNFALILTEFLLFWTILDYLVSWKLVEN
jgi:hypothetical protein